ncbi:ATP-binding cassette domain-containing protein [Rhizobiaceae sp. 2RAB30]
MSAAERETAGGAAHPACIRLIDVGKSFAGVQVLRNISLDFRQGEIHALVGENGAGKSTVGKIAGGYYSRSSGDLEVFGEKVGSWDAATALTRGIAMMHQELQLVPELTVAQNVFLGIENRRAGFLMRDEDRRLAAPLIAALAALRGVTVGVNEPYSPADRVYFTLERHARSRGLPCAMIEIRNDEISAQAGQRKWADLLTGIFADLKPENAEGEIRSKGNDKPAQPATMRG